MKLCKIYHALMVAGLLLAVPALHAQVYFSCDFEDDTQNQQWVLNAGGRASQIENHWFIGRPGNFSQEGAKGLFISSDSVNAVYTSKAAMYTVASINLTLQPGTYSLDFDWRLLGNGTSAQLYVVWVPQTQGTNCNTSAPGTWVTQNALGNGGMRGQRSWKPERMNLTITSANSNGKLCFVFTSAQDGKTPPPPSACVDNIVIHEKVSCPTPSGLTYNESTATLSWTGSGSLFQLRDYNAFENTLTEVDSITAKKWKVQINGEGTHVFYVRSVCGDGQYSEWASVSSFVWIPGMRCLDYMDLDNSKVCTCYTGQANSSPNYNAWEQVRVVPGIQGSWLTGSHTKHTNLDETDHNTDNMLPTVPEGEIMSIRLGNATTNSGAEGIEYYLNILPGESKILILKYALVLNYVDHHDPGGSEGSTHGSNEQSHFYVEIRDQQNHPQGEGCSTFDFSATPSGAGVDQTWHISEAPVDPVGGGGVMWKEWTEVRISLVAFAGQRIKIRLSNYDCTAGGHWGYAYFTMGCVDGGLEGIACGDFSTDHFEAPEGFNYRWYAADDPNHTVLSTNRIYNISPTTDSIYLVDVINPINDCYYTLTANPNPRFPKAVADTIVSHTNCMNLVEFTNDSYVRIVNRKDGTDMPDSKEPIYDVYFDYGDGTTETVRSNKIKHEYPQEGGHFHAFMVASMSDGVCSDTIHFEFDMPDILHSASYNDTLQVCKKNERYVHKFRDNRPDMTFVFADYPSDTIDYFYEMANQYGCTSPCHLRLLVGDQVDVFLYDTICDGESVRFANQIYSKSGIYTDRVMLPSGCDSVTTLFLQVRPRMEIAVPPIVDVCGVVDAPGDIVIPLTFLPSRLECPFDKCVQDTCLSVTVRMDRLAQNAGFQPEYHFPVTPDMTGLDLVIPMPKRIRPNRYLAEVHMENKYCATDSTVVLNMVHYSDSIMVQKYGFISIINEEYNYGGFKFSSYQWYCDSVLLSGETKSYILLNEDNYGHNYYLEVVRADDNVKMTTCELFFDPEELLSYDNIYSSAMVSPTIAMPGETIRVVGARSQIRLVDVLGRSYDSAAVNGLSDMAQTLRAPQQPGMYFIVFDNQYSVKILVR